MLNLNNNSALKGGAIYLYNSTIHVNTDTILFYDNRDSWRGAIYLVYGTIHINPNKSLEFVKNTAQVQGTAIYVESGDSFSVSVDSSAKLFLLTIQHFKEVPSMLCHHHLQSKSGISRLFSL